MFINFGPSGSSRLPGKYAIGCFVRNHVASEIKNVNVRFLSFVTRRLNALFFRVNRHCHRSYHVRFFTVRVSACGQELIARTGCQQQPLNETG
jgi:hypothetical protein